MNALRIGQMYTLVEKKAPDGYMMLTNAVYFIPERNNIILCDENGNHVNSIPNVETDGTLSIIVTNHAGTELPQTGGPGTTKLYMFSALLIAGAAGGLIYKTRRRQRG